MDSTNANLLQAAAQIVGGEHILAQRLGIDPSLLADLLTGQRELPERVLLGSVDIILGKYDPSPPVSSAEPSTQGQPSVG